ncbi:hypothetical protein AX16_011026 [Volvariella volvacea WC 439]|nr:hypothetical protein AX16_011026 [Volvariella volvacea WC 439]
MRFKTFVSILKLFLALTMSVVYLSICWIVQHRTVLVPSYSYFASSYYVYVEHLELIKSGIATINILTILLTLLPIKSLLMDLKGEEFIRLLRRSSSEQHRGPGGTDLATANLVSSSSLGILAAILIILKKRCSFHFVVAVGAGFIVTAIFALAPATLSVRVVIVDYLDPYPRYVGSMDPLSVAVINTSPKFMLHTQRISATCLHMMSKNDFKWLPPWAGTAMNFSYSFGISNANPSSEFPKYIIPFPINFPPSTSAIWTTDAFALHPNCGWQQQDATNSSSVEYLYEKTIAFHGRSRNIAFNFDLISDIGDVLGNEPDAFEIFYASVSLNGSYTIWNTITNDVLSEAYSVWVIVYRITDMGGIFASRNVPTFDPDTLRLAILMCSPGFSIESVEVRNEGTNLIISPSNNSTQLDSLDQRQAELFFTVLLRDLPQYTSPKMLGLPSGTSQIQASLIFGWDQVAMLDSMDDGTGIWMPYPLSLQNITDAYATYLQSTSKPYMSGVLGAAKAPRTVSKPALAFTASRGYVVASTILLAVLNMINFCAYFRSSRGEGFSLFTAAGVLYNSNVPEEVMRFRKKYAGLRAEDMADEFEEESKNLFVTLEYRDDVDRSEFLVLHGAAH